VIWLKLSDALLVAAGRERASQVAAGIASCDVAIGSPALVASLSVRYTSK